jgi:hypothetical protein
MIISGRIRGVGRVRRIRGVGGVTMVITMVIG